MMHAKKGNRQWRWTAKSGIAVLLSAMLVLQSVGGISVQAEEATGQAGETAETPEDGGSDVPETPEGGSSDVPESGDPAETPAESTGSSETTQTPTESTGGSETVQAPTEGAGGSETSETQTETTGESNTAQAPTESTGDNGTAETPTESAGDGGSTETTTDTGSGETEENPTETAGDDETAAETVTEETTTAETITEAGSTEAVEESTESETETESGTELTNDTDGEIEFVRTPEGAIILSGFEPLTDEESRIILDKKEALEEVKSRMPSALKAYASVKTDSGDEEVEEPLVSGMVVTTGRDSVQKIMGRAEHFSEENAPGVNVTEPFGKPKENTIVSVEVPVTWECMDNYETGELAEYHFRPVWDSTAYYYESDEFPVIVVRIKGGGTVIVSRTADVVFVIDVSSSMSTYIAKVKERIAEFNAKLSDAGVNVRIKFVLYSDYAYSEKTVCSGWCSTTEEATQALDSIQMLGGGDGPETAIDGMGFMFQDDFGWRESVAKFSILLTDAPCKTDNQFNYTSDDITEKLEEKDIVSSVIVPSSVGDYDKWQVNGGKKGNIASDYSFLLEWVDDIIIPGVDKTFQNVTVEVKKDTVPWPEHGRSFRLQNIDKGFYVENFNAVENGTYRIYEVTASGVYLDTGTCIAVSGEDITATVNYYTVSFFDGDKVYDQATKQALQIVLNGQTASRPDPPAKQDCLFTDWMTENNGTTPFDFSQGIVGTTSVYAGWKPNTYSVDIKVQKDSAEWEGHGKTFCLKKKDTEISVNDSAVAGTETEIPYVNDTTDEWITDLTKVKPGTYEIYDATDNTAVADTGVTVTVDNSNAEAVIDYFTVTFYNETSVFSEQIVLNDTMVSEPSERPVKEEYDFSKWVDAEGVEFNFTIHITKKTDIYAGWTPKEKFTITVSAGNGGSVSPDGSVAVISGNDQEFAIAPKKDYRIASVKVDGNKVELSDASTAYASETGSANAAKGTKYYVFENVTADHTLTVSFQSVKTGKIFSAPVDNTPQEQAVPVVAKIAPPPKAAPTPEPKTGDAALPAIPISLGACTVFMIKIRMWLYEFELGISEEKKNEILQALFSWARGTTKPKVYMAVGASAVVLTIYHILKVLDEKRKRLVEKFGK